MVKAGIITGFGVNADVELGEAFELAGAHAQFLHITTLMENPSVLEGLDILAFPGGFSFGDHLGSGRVFAQLVKKNLKEPIDAFVKAGKLVIGICNGFQVLVKMGILPNLAGDWTPETTLITNSGGTFIDKWVSVKYNTSNNSPWLAGLTDGDLPIRHGEGRFIPMDEALLKVIQDNNLVALTYKENPNGSTADIAGITDKTGRIFGLMPHPEAFTVKTNHPLWRRRENVGVFGLKVFENGIDYIKNSKKV